VGQFVFSVVKTLVNQVGASEHYTTAPGNEHASVSWDSSGLYDEKLIAEERLVPTA